MPLTPDEQINDIWLAVYVEQESYPFWVDLTRDTHTDTTNLLINLDILSAYLHSEDGLGDIRFGVGALYTDLVTGEITNKVEVINSYVAPDDDGNSVGVIRVQTNKIPDIISDVGAVAIDVAGLVVSIATVETGIGLVGVAVEGAALVTDAIKLQQDLMKEDTDQIPFINEDLSDLTEAVSALQSDVTDLLQLIPEVERIYEIQTDTDNDGFTYALDKMPDYDRPHLQVGLLGFKWVTDYLAALVLTNPPAGYYEFGPPTTLAEVTVFDLTHAYGFRVIIDPVPDYYGTSEGPPYIYSKFGIFSYGRMGGYHGYEPIIFAPTVVMPLPAGVESVRIQLEPGLTGTVERIEPTFSD